MNVFSLDLNTATESLLGTAFTIQCDSCHIEQSSSRTSVANCHRPMARQRVIEQRKKRKPGEKRNVFSLWLSDRTYTIGLSTQ